MPAAAHTASNAQAWFIREPHVSFVIGVSGLTLGVDCSASYGTSTPIVLSSWDFGDGGTATGVTPSHAYASGGTYIVTYTATQADGATASTSQAVTMSGVATASSNVLAVGDSLTYGQDATSSAWPIAFASGTGINTVNPSKAGWTSVDMAIKVGAIDPSLTFPGNSIPASGSVTLTAISPSSGYRMATGINQSYVGSVSGIVGTLTHTANTTTWTFTRTTTGSAVAVSGAVAFHCSEYDADQSFDLIIMLGRNDLNYTGYSDTIINSLNAIIAHSTGSRYLIVGTLALLDSADLAKVQAMNQTLRTTYGDSHYFDAQSYLASSAAFTAVGTTPSSTDTSQIASGYVPDGLSTTSDRPHLNANGYTSLGDAIADKVSNLGWLASGSGGGVQPTGSGITRYQDVSGSTFSAHWQAAGTNKLSLQANTTYTITDFLSGSGQGRYAAASDLTGTNGSLGILGAGAGSSVITVAANSMTQPSGVTSVTSSNQFTVIVTKNKTSPVFDGFEIDGTNQRNIYGGISIDGCTNPTISNVLIKNVPGDNASPPGETFYISHHSGTGGIFDTIECDGSNGSPTDSTQWVGAAMAATNTTTGAFTVRRLFGHESRWSKSFAGWQSVDGGQFTEVWTVNTAFGIGFEEMSGTYYLDNCVWGGNQADIHLGHSSVYNGGAKATLIVRNPTFLGGQTKLKAFIPPGYSGGTSGTVNQQSASDITILTGSDASGWTDVTSSMLAVQTSYPSIPYNISPLVGYPKPSWALQ